MNIRGITDILKGAKTDKNDKKSELEAVENNIEQELENNDMENEQKPISDEVENPAEAQEEVEEKPVRIKTIVVTEENKQNDETEKKSLKNNIKIIAGLSILAAAGIAAVIFNSKKKR